MSARVIVVIPARGGSKGIPRKNLRPLAGKPLLWYSIQAARAANPDWSVVVSTEDAEIALMAERFGASVVRRPPHLAGDEVTIDPVVVDAVAQSEAARGAPFDVVVTVQPTSPLLEGADIAEGVSRLLETGADTVISVTDDRHLRWRLDDAGQAVPSYAARVNRQRLPREFRETGAVVCCRREVLGTGSRLGKRIELSEVAAEKSIDIDSFSDMALCEFLLSRKTVVFVVAGNPTIGLGHAYRALTIAHELVQHHIEFLCPAGHELAAEVIRSRFYSVQVVPQEQLVAEIARRRPQVVVNDILDTEAEFIRAQKQLGARVVNFEDLGPGLFEADIVVNALYPEEHADPRVLSGPEYFCLRDEFLYLPEVPRERERLTVLATFGGVDEGNLTCRMLDVWQRLADIPDAHLDVLLGPGYGHAEALEKIRASLDPARVTISPATTRISDHMLAADAAVTSGGRTVFEMAALRVPTIVVCQNARELTHTFAKEENGILNLGHRDAVSQDDLERAVRDVLTSTERRAEMVRRVSAFDFHQGKARVISAINRLFQPE